MLRIKDMKPRKVYCKFYDKCLTAAALKNLPEFSCLNCKKYTLDKGNMEAVTHKSEYTIFDESHPDVYKESFT